MKDEQNPSVFAALHNEIINNQRFRETTGGDYVLMRRRRK